MMKVIECRDYNKEFPETFTWGHVDSIKLSSLAFNIVNHINHDLKKDRNYVAGLRLALNLIAEVAEV